MNAYDYAPMYRPPGYGTLPEGFDIVASGKWARFPLRTDLAERSDCPFGVVRYRRPLSAEEIERYDLRAV